MSSYRLMTLALPLSSIWHWKFSVESLSGSSARCRKLWFTYRAREIMAKKIHKDAFNIYKVNALFFEYSMLPYHLSHISIIVSEFCMTPEHHICHGLVWQSAA